MSPTPFLLLLPVLALALVRPARAEEPSEAPPTLGAAVASLEGASTFASLVRGTPLAEALGGAGPLTVLVPTDEAFAALPSAAREALAAPAGRDALLRVLAHHVVVGLVADGALDGATSLAGERLALAGATARTAQAAANGVLVLVDRVIVPPTTGVRGDDGVAAAIAAAIERGAPLYNEGNHAACALAYAATAAGLAADDPSPLRVLHRASLARALATGEDAGARAWALRRAFDALLLDLEFVPRSEAPLPAGFPGPGPVGAVVVKEYPRYRAARAEGGGSFWTLFRHIKRNEVAMTAPVEMTMDGDLGTVDMAFLYQAPDQGKAGTDGQVEVLDLAPLTVLSVAIRGSSARARLEEGKAALEARARAEGWTAAGPYRLLGYNSPMVPAERRLFELQLPVTR